jgi:ubiquinone/menaquinone biosynthesis C-methylase UbiE
MRTRALLCAAALSVAGCSVAAKIDYAHLFSRRGWQRTDRVIETLRLRAGDRVADIGAGDGYFTFWLADAVGPAGRVYAIDVDADAVKRVQAAARQRGYANVVAVLAKPEDPMLPDGSIDLAFLCNAYHHLDDRVPYFERLRADLAPDARLAVIEMRDRGLAALVTPEGHTTSVPAMRDELDRAGYRHLQSHDLLPLQSFELFAPRSAYDRP